MEPHRIQPQGQLQQDSNHLCFAKTYSILVPVSPTQIATWQFYYNFKICLDDASTLTITMESETGKKKNSEPSRGRGGGAI